MEDAELTLGQILRKARSDMGMSLEHVASKLKINVLHLEHIENGMAEYELPKVYCDGYSKLYAKFLGINQDLVQNYLCKKTQIEEMDVSIYNSKEEIGYEIKVRNIYKNHKLGFVLSFIVMIILFEVIYLYHNNGISSSDMKKHIIKSAQISNSIINTYDKNVITQDNIKIFKEYTTYNLQSGLMANSNTMVKIYDSTSRLISSQYLKSGDILFIPNDEGIIIDAEDKNAVEYFDRSNFQTLEERLTHKLSDPFYIRSARFIPYSVD